MAKLWLCCSWCLEMSCAGRKAALSHEMKATHSSRCIMHKYSPIFHVVSAGWAPCPYACPSKRQHSPMEVYLHTFTLDCLHACTKGLYMGQCHHSWMYMRAEPLSHAAFCCSIITCYNRSSCYATNELIFVLTAGPGSVMCVWVVVWWSVMCCSDLCTCSNKCWVI